MRPTFRICASLIGIVLATATASLGSDTLTPSQVARGALAPLDGTPQPAACCKICTKGKACGNSCIARDKSCHQPPGCACDG